MLIDVIDDGHGGANERPGGGVAVLRYGPMRELTLGLEAVLPDGRLVVASMFDGRLLVERTAGDGPAGLELYADLSDVVTGHLGDLVADAQGDGLAVAANRRLGLVTDGFFHDAGIDLHREARSVERRVERGDTDRHLGRLRAGVQCAGDRGAPVGRAVDDLRRARRDRRTTSCP